MHLFFHLSGYIQQYNVRVVCPRIPWSSIRLEAFHLALLLSYFQFFLVLSRVLLAYCPSLISSWLLIIFVIGSCVILGVFSSKLSKCCVYRCIRSFSLRAFSFAFAVLFLQLTMFTFFHVILFTQTLRSGRIWHRSIFKRSLTGLNSEFSFS